MKWQLPWLRHTPTSLLSLPHHLHVLCFVYTCSSVNSKINQTNVKLGDKLFGEKSRRVNPICYHWLKDSWVICVFGMNVNRLRFCAQQLE